MLTPERLRPAAIRSGLQECFPVYLADDDAGRSEDEGEDLLRSSVSCSSLVENR